MAANDVVITISAKNLTKKEFDLAKKDLAGVGEAARGTRARLGDLRKGIGEAVESLTGMRLATLGGVAAVGALVGGIVKATKDTIELGSSLVDLNTKTGISVQALQELKFASEQAGVGFDQTTDAVLQLGRRAAADLPEATKQLKALGLSVEDIVNRKPDEAFALVAERIREIRSPAEQAAAAMAIFGRQGLELLPLINQGVQENIDRFRGLGAAMSDVAARDAKVLADSLTDLNAQWTNFKTTIGSAVIPVLNQVVKWFNTDFPLAVDFVQRINAEWTANFIAAQAKTAEVLALFSDHFVTIADDLRNQQREWENLAKAEQLSLQQKLAQIQTGDQQKETLKQTTAAIQNQTLATKSATFATREFSTIQANYPTVAEGMIQGITLADSHLVIHAFHLAQARQRVEELGIATRNTTRVMSADWAQMELQREKRSASTLDFLKGANADLLANSLNIFGSLSSSFKSVAIAGAIISTYSAIAKALGAYPWPFNLVAAAAAGAAGWANVNRIRSTERGFREGTQNLDFENFGAATPTVLHRREAVIPQTRTNEFADMVAARLGRRGGGTGEGITINMPVNIGSGEAISDAQVDALIRKLRGNMRGAADELAETIRERVR